MDAIVVTHSTALYAILCARRRYAGLPWEQLSRSQQQRALASCAPNERDLDLDDLERLGVWSPELGCLDVLVASSSAQRRSSLLRPHVFSNPLPSNSLLRVSGDVYCVSPALAAIQFASDHSWQETLALLYELCGTFSLSDQLKISVDQIGQPLSRRTYSLNDPFAQPDVQIDSWPEQIHQDQRDAGYLASEAVLTSRQFDRYVSNAKNILGLPCARKAARYVLDGAASPMEAIMAAMFHAPQSVGGFGIKEMQLNLPIEFSHDAVLASGMSRAVLDAYIPQARATLEYNGHYHDARGSRIHDEKRTTGLQAMSILSIPVNDEQLQNLDALEAIAKTLYKRMGKQFRFTTNDYRSKQAKLLNALRHQMGLDPC